MNIQNNHIGQWRSEDGIVSIFTRDAYGIVFPRHASRYCRLRDGVLLQERKVQSSDIEQSLFLVARRTTVRAPRQSFVVELRRMISGVAISAAAICSAAALLGAGLPTTSDTERTAVYPFTTDTHQATIQQKQPAQVAELLI